MSCIKFPSSKSELVKTSHSNNTTDSSVANSYLISTADQAFGKGTWNHAITSQTLDFIDSVAGSYRAGCACIVRIQLNNGNFHETVGYSCAEGSSKGSAIQKSRFGSYIDAFKKTLVCFGVNIPNKTSDLSNCVKNSQGIESTSTTVTPKKENATVIANQFVNKVSRSSNRPKSPLVSEPTSSALKKENNSVAANQIEFDPFESLPLSQTDVLMDTVDIDQLFSKDQNPVDVNRVPNEVKTSTTKSTVSIDKTISVAGRSSTVDLNEKKAKVEGPTVSSVKASKNVASNDQVGDKSNSSNGLKIDEDYNLQKPIVYTVPTEEEARLERKRKQKEKQDEFKRKQEIKRSCSLNMEKQPHPRY